MVGDTGIEPMTSSVSGKRATAAPIALVTANVTVMSGHARKLTKSSSHGGGYRIRTGVYGFAGRCLASRPIHQKWHATTGEPVEKHTHSSG